MISGHLGAVPQKALQALGQKRPPGYWLRLSAFFAVTLVLGMYLGFSPAIQRRFYDEKVLFKPQKADRIETLWYGRRAEEVYFKNSAGNRLHALYFRSPAAARRTILVNHGQADNLNAHAKVMDNLLSLPENEVFIYDYSGFGKSQGRPSIPGAMDDARSAYDYLVHEQKVRPRKLVIYGASLGSGPATMLASERDCAGLVLISAYKNVKSAARDNLSFLHIYPDFLLSPVDFETLQSISKVHVPLLILHGAQDRMISVSHGEAIYAAANEPKTFVRSETAGHKDFSRQERRRILDFLEETVP